MRLLLNEFTLSRSDQNLQFLLYRWHGRSPVVIPARNTKLVKRVRLRVNAPDTGSKIPRRTKSCHCLHKMNIKIGFADFKETVHLSNMRFYLR